MARFALLVTAIVAFPLTALGDTNDDRPAVGRYQLTGSMEGLYFLDTTTGELWLKENHGEWQKVDSPVARAPKIADQPRKPVSLTLAKGGETMPMVQRERRAIPGSAETLWVELGDITGGQVFVEVSDHNGQMLLDRTSLKEQEFARFKVNEMDVYLQITEMVNNLLGDDICKVRLSHKKPELEQKVEGSSDADEP